MKHAATINAYETKTGGFRGVLLIRATRQRIASDVLPSLEAAAFWCKSKAHELYDEEGYRLAPVRKSGEYYANVWTN